MIVGGEMRFLGSLEYMMPLTADDMIKGVVFCDYGTVEENIEFNSDNFRVAVGTGRAADLERSSDRRARHRQPVKSPVRRE